MGNKNNYIKLKDGDNYYEGNFLNGLKDGDGKYFWKNGDIYEAGDCGLGSELILYLFRI